MPEPHRATIAIGSNLPSRFGSPRQNLLTAIDRIGSLGQVTVVSSILQTEPEIYTAQPQFLNAALLLETSLDPHQLMHALLAIELAMGRVREGVPAKGPRSIDLDLILYDQLVIDTPELTLPHPAMSQRRFVLQPLAEIAPDWVHPLTGFTVRAMLERLSA
jgi:2-amino-4-hydroxy-6-hydroxymethyldihydropteridine diphosphokinase